MDTQTRTILQDICYAISAVAEETASLVEQSTDSAAAERAKQLRGVVDKLLEELR
jgi:hypothetical protein